MPSVAMLFSKHKDQEHPNVFMSKQDLVMEEQVRYHRDRLSDVS